MSQSTFRSLLLSALICASPLPAWAEEYDQLFDLSLESLANITVVTASLKRESVKDTPVPVTVITDEMIQRSGITDIKQLLTLFVPGFTAVEDQNERNIAARGVFTSSQQKILFLLNGHRLNSRSYSMAAPDFSVSLDKVQQIEVLRGPASSLYGNVALTAVVNIILKNGADIDGINTHFQLGNHGQKLASILWGKQSGENDVLAWAQLYQAEGEDISISPQQAYSDTPAHDRAIVGGITDNPSHDIGVRWFNEFHSIMLNQRSAHYIEPFSAGGISGEPYDYERFEQYKNLGPGFGYISNHFNYQFKFPLNQNWETTNTLTHDDISIDSPVVTQPETGSYAVPSWKDRSYGAQSMFRYNDDHHDLLFGFQLDYFEVFDDQLKVGSNFELTTKVPGKDPLLKDGSETTQSLFSQYKYAFSKQWLTNLGLRFDRKIRLEGEDLEVISPRLALIYKTSTHSTKLSYSRSFVDASYWNRFSKLSSFRGANSLEPEYLTTWQLNPSWDFDNLLYSANLYYSEAQDFIFLDSQAMANEANFSNSGELSYWGLEQEVTWQFERWKVHGAASYIQAISSERISDNDGDIANVPALTISSNIDYSWSPAWRSNFSVRYIGNQFSPVDIQSNGVRAVDSFPSEGVVFNAPNNKVAAVTLFDTAIHYSLSRWNSTISLMVENILDEEYSQGGSTQFPYPQPGRWYRVGLKTDW